MPSSADMIASMQELALYMPALMALGVYDHLHRGNLSTRKLVIAFGVFAVFINLCVNLVVLYLFGNDEVAFTGKSFIKYLSAASFFALVLPFVVNLIENTVAIEVKKNDKS